MAFLINIEDRFGTFYLYKTHKMTLIGACFVNTRKSQENMMITFIKS